MNDVYIKSYYRILLFEDGWVSDAAVGESVFFAPSDSDSVLVSGTFNYTTSKISVKLVVNGSGLISLKLSQSCTSA